MKCQSSKFPAWICALIFAGFGVLLGWAGMKMAVLDWQWANAINTTGRVIAATVRKENNESRLFVLYGYKDENGVIYHNTALVARGLGRVNLEPGATVIVLYRGESHQLSRLQLEIGSHEWLPILALAFLEIVSGVAFLKWHTA